MATTSIPSYYSTQDATKNTYANVEETVYKYLKENLKLPLASICAVFANIDYLTSQCQNSEGVWCKPFDPQALQKKASTAYVGGYGLFQWYGEREKTLSNLYSNDKKGITTPHQLLFFQLELENMTVTHITDGEMPFLEFLQHRKNTKDNAETVSVELCRLYFKPRHEQAMKDRDNDPYEESSYSNDSFKRFGNNYIKIRVGKFWSHYTAAEAAAAEKPPDPDPPEPDPQTTPLNENYSIPNDIGGSIVAYARSLKDNNVPYKQGGVTAEGVDEAGLVYYSYSKASVTTIPSVNMTGLYNYLKLPDIATSVEATDVRAGDILIYGSATNITDVAIATGEGTRIHAPKSSSKVIESSGLSTPFAIYRVLADSQTTPSITTDQTAVPYPGISAVSYATLTSYDETGSSILNNLSVLESEGYDYGYLIDITHNDPGSINYFKFYIPEFTESAGAEWEPVDLRGRSVSVLAYNKTGSREISISLDLYAGEGLYKASAGESFEDNVTRLHKDAYFVKSLEYPDYSNAIVRPPSTVHLILGSAIDIVGVVSDVQVEHQKPLDSQNRSMYLKLSFKVTQIATNPPDYRDIRNGIYTIASSTNLGK